MDQHNFNLSGETSTITGEGDVTACWFHDSIVQLGKNVKLHNCTFNNAFVTFPDNFEATDCFFNKEIKFKDITGPMKLKTLTITNCTIEGHGTITGSEGPVSGLPILRECSLCFCGDMYLGDVCCLSNCTARFNEDCKLVIDADVRNGTLLLDKGAWLHLISNTSMHLNDKTMAVGENSSVYIVGLGTTWNRPHSSLKVGKHSKFYLNEYWPSITTSVIEVGDYCMVRNVCNYVMNAHKYRASISCASIDKAFIVPDYSYMKGGKNAHRPNEKAVGTPASA